MMRSSSTKSKDYCRSFITFSITLALLYIIQQSSSLFDVQQYFTSFYLFDKNDQCGEVIANRKPNDLIGIYGDLTNQYQNSNIDSESELVKQLFNQGMIQLYGYNREEAEKNFQAAIKIDSQCGACLVGVILSNGPTINNHVEQYHLENARIAIAEAQKVFDSKPSIQSIFKTVFTAQTIRFSNSTELWLDKGQHYFDILYSAAMKDVFNTYSDDDDDDIAAMYADSLLLLTPWDYFVPAGMSTYKEIPGATSIRFLEELKPHMQVAYTVLSNILKRNPKHLLALHLFIHILEQTHQVSAASSAADSLASVAGTTGTGHLIHMPSHIYVRLGRYNDAISSSLRAIALDSHYEQNCLSPYAKDHNVAMLVVAGVLQGRLHLALEHASYSTLKSSVMLSALVSALFPLPRDLVLIRFGRWHDVLTLQEQERRDFFRSIGTQSGSELRDEFLKLRYLREEALEDLALSNVPPDDKVLSSDAELLYLEQTKVPIFQRVIHCYATALAQIHLSHTGSHLARLALQRMELLVRQVPTDALLESHVFYPYHVEVASLMNLTAHAAWQYKVGDFAGARWHLQNAVDLQDSFSYMEPENFYIPLRQCFGELLLQSAEALKENESSLVSIAALSRYADAADAFRVDLEEHPNNVWSLSGIVSAIDGAEALNRVYKSASINSDVKGTLNTEWENTFRRATGNNAQELRLNLRTALQYADSQLKSSCFEISH